MKTYRTYKGKDILFFRILEESKVQIDSTRQRITRGQKRKSQDTVRHVTQNCFWNKAKAANIIMMTKLKMPLLSERITIKESKTRIEYSRIKSSRILSGAGGSYEHPLNWVS